ncbi:MAG: DUF5719 family protein [Rhodospirillaceae bacterium]|nr:DUF5719 family protein [Rhodospirillaceae bacterium]
MPKYPWLVPLFLCLAAGAAAAAPVEFSGDYSFDVGPAGDTVTVEIEELRNASSTETTGRLFVSLRYTQCDTPTSQGYRALVVEDEDGGRQDVFPLDRVVTGGNSTLAPGASWTGIRFTTGYLPPPSGTFRTHLVIYESDDANPDEVADEQSGAASFPRRHVERGAEEYDSCFTARVLDANEQQGNRLGFYDRTDYHRLQSYSRGALAVEVTGDVDAIGELLDNDGRLLERASKGVGSETLRIERHIDDRVYYFQLTAGGQVYGAYTLRTTHTPGTGGAARDRDDDTAERATPLPLGVEVNDAIDERGDEDWWLFETRTSGRFIIETAGGTDTLGRLMDGSVELLAADNDSGEGRNFRIDDGAVVEAGTYYLRVSGSSSFFTGPYTLRAVLVPEDASGRPDLVVDLHDASTVELMPGESFVFYANVRNRGNGASEDSVVRFFRSNDRLISLDDTWVSTERVNALEPFSSWENSVVFRGTEEIGHFYIGACVRQVEGESDADSHNNCTQAVRVEVRDGGETTDPVARRYAVPLFLSTSDSRRHGFLRLINRSDEAGTVTIHAVDDAGVRHGPVEISVEARETIHFNSEDLESGNPDKGITGSVDAGEGNWRLELTTHLDVAPLAYVRTEDGFLTSVHGTAETLDDGRYYLPFFNPASNTRQVSSLRLVNPGTEDADITITGIDDRGEPSPEGEASLTLPAGEARAVTALELESGGDALQGRLGSGSGKWRLFLSATAPIEASSLLDSPTGNLSNLSPRGRKRSLSLVLPVSRDGRQGFVRIINWSDAPGSVHIRGVTDSGKETDAVTLTLDADAAAHFNSWDLQFGNEDKGLSGGIGHGHGGGGWRLELQSDLDVEALAYVRTEDGFVTGMHDLAVNVEGIVEVPFFNPASNTNQESRLRLVNRGEDDAVVTISGWDDIGAAPSYGAVRMTVRNGDSRTITARELEAGARVLRGRFGDGIGKWRLSVASEQPVEVMSLLESPTGHLSNLSSPAR